MQILSLLGKVLKHDEVIELLDHYDVEVTYDFDRLHENSPDIYWASIKPMGVQLRFNEHQTLDTIFCYIEPRESFASIALETIGAVAFDSFAIAEQACQLSDASYQVSTPPGSWLKVLATSHDTHYQFNDGRLSMITLMLPWNR